MPRLLVLLLALSVCACPPPRTRGDDDTVGDDDDSGDDDDATGDDDDSGDDDDATGDDDDASGDDDDGTGDDDDGTGDDDDATGDDDDATSEPVFEPTRWRSTLYPDSWDPSYTLGGLFLHDFSYAGYHRGEDPLPTSVPGISYDVTAAAFGADPTGTVDSTAAIQAAIDAAGAAGGGTVHLPPGTYLVAPSGDPWALRIRYDGVVLKGAGREATHIINTRTDMRGRQVILMQPYSGGSWITDTGNAVSLVADAAERDTTVTVTNASSFSVDQLVVVRSTATADWIADHDQTAEWTTASLQGPTFLRRVVSITGNTLQLDIPLRYPLLTRDDARVEPADDHMVESGIEDLSIGMLQHPGTSGWGDNDYSVSGTSAYDVHNADVIVMKYVVDGWIRRVGTVRPAANADDVHMLSDGLVLVYSRSITVEDSSFDRPQYEGGGGNGYGFVLQGSDNLLVDCGAVSTRHGFSFKKSWAHGNVIRGGVSANPRLGVDFHMHLAFTNLIDGLTLEDDYIDATYRPYGTVIHGHTTSQSVLWNTVGIDGSGDALLVDSRQFGDGYAIGTRGQPFDIQTTPLVDTKDTSPEDHREGEGSGETLQPESLYVDQLSRRLNGVAAPTAVPLVTVPVVADAYVRGGASNNTTNYGGDAELRVKDAGSSYIRESFLRFDLASVPRAPSRATLVLDCETQDSGGDLADLRAFAVDDDSWIESQITYNNRPGAGAFLSRVITDDPPAEVALDVTEHVRAEWAGDGVVSLALLQEQGGDGLLVECSSKEGSVPPVLEVELGPAVVLPVVAVTGDPGDTGTALANTIDGDLGTRWSNLTHGAQVTWDLGAVEDVTGLGLAFHAGDIRVGFFEIRVSADNVTWTTVDGGVSTGRSLQHQIRMWESSVSARYVRYVGFGNSDSAWNSLTGVQIYGQ